MITTKAELQRAIKSGLDKISPEMEKYNLELNEIQFVIKNIEEYQEKDSMIGGVIELSDTQKVKAVDESDRIDEMNHNYIRFHLTTTEQKIYKLIEKSQFNEVKKTEDLSTWEGMIANEQIQITTSLKQDELSTLKTQVSELQNSKLQLLADFQNYKKRVQREQEDFMGLANKDLLGRVIESIDDFNRAISQESEKSEPSFKELVKGCEMILDKLTSMLRDQGLEQLNTKVGDKFNPNQMEALTTVPTEKAKEDNTVIHIDQQGYINRNNKQIFKPAKVIIAKKN